MGTKLLSRSNRQSITENAVDALVTVATFGLRSVPSQIAMAGYDRRVGARDELPTTRRPNLPSFPRTSPRGSKNNYVRQNIS
jgi:hypothetical protein